MTLSFFMQTWNCFYEVRLSLLYISPCALVTMSLTHDSFLLSANLKLLLWGQMSLKLNRVKWTFCEYQSVILWEVIQSVMAPIPSVYHQENFQARKNDLILDKNLRSCTVNIKNKVKIKDGIMIIKYPPKVILIEQCFIF